MRKKIRALICIILIFSLFLSGCMKKDQEAHTRNVNVKYIDVTAEQTIVNSNLNKEVKAGHTFTNPFVTLDPYGIAPLSAIAVFKTEDSTGVKIKIVGHDESADIIHEFPKGKDHIIPIYGLYASEENTVVLTLDDGTSKELKIKTDSINTPFAKAEVIKADKERMKDGLTFLTPALAGTDAVAAAAFDANGELRWLLKGNNAAWAIRRLENGRLLIGSDRSAGPPYYTLGVREVDMMGKIYTEYVVPGGYHHDARIMNNGNLLIATEKHGSDSVEDVVVEVDHKTGKVVKTFDLAQIIPTDDGSSLNATKKDWFHNNSVWLDEKTETMILSGRHADAVIAVDYDTGKLKWILGDPEGWAKVDKKYFFTPVGKDFQWQYAQHAAMITPQGYIFLFDNGIFRAKKSNQEKQISGDDNYSRAVMYRINEENMTIEQVWQFGKERGAQWFSPFICDVDYFEDGHYLLESGGILYDSEKKSYNVQLSNLFNTSIKKKASTIEYENNEVVFEMSLNTNVYRAERITPYVDGDNFNINTVGKVLGNLEKEKFITDLNLLAKEVLKPDFFTVNASQEPDRIVVNGSWNAGKMPQDAKLILKSVDNGNYLGLQIDQPSAAPKSDQPVAFSKWSSTTGLKGEYDIYILADNTLYSADMKFYVK